MNLSKKIDFAVIFKVVNANPNGDPLNGNRPRTDFDGKGEVSDVCLKRKIRDRLLESGHGIYVQSDDRRIDDHRSLKERFDAVIGKDTGNQKVVADKACAAWFDVRAFGQLFPFKGKAGKKGESDEGDAAAVSIGIRGPVSVQPAFSVDPVSVTSTQITKSVSAEGDGTKRGSDTMGMKHRVDGGIYVFKGSMNPQLAVRTGFGDADAAVLKSILPRMFENDASAARPEGSMRVLNVVWWEHNCPSGQYSSGRVHDSLTVNPDGSHALAELPGLTPEVLEGF
jgi:CRISPR-associated protein Csd2